MFSVKYKISNMLLYKYNLYTKSYCVFLLKLNNYNWKEASQFYTTKYVFDKENLQKLSTIIHDHIPERILPKALFISSMEICCWCCMHAYQPFRILSKHTYSPSKETSQCINAYQSLWLPSTILTPLFHMIRSLMDAPWLACLSIINLIRGELPPDGFGNLTKLVHIWRDKKKWERFQCWNERWSGVYESYYFCKR